MFAQTPANLTSERWTGIPGLYINLLKEQGISQRPPDISELLPGAATSEYRGDRYGARLRGTITAPVTGNYTFFISSDNSGELWLSETSFGMGKQRIAHHSGWTGLNIWNKYETQRSRTFTLQAGQQCYIEGLMKEDTGGDHLSIGWSYEPTVPLQQTDLGAPVSASWTETNGTYAANVKSGDIWGNNDRCSTRLRTWSGDGEFITRISDMSNPNNWAKAGLMIRSSTAANAQNVMLGHTGSNGMAFQYRAIAGSSSSHFHVNVNVEWVKLVRKGNIITGHVSPDGVTWSAAGSVTLAGLPTVIHVGLAASNHGSVNPLTVAFSHFSAAPFTAMEVIPASQLTSFAADPLDVNGDNLPDAWQSLYPMSGTAFAKSEFGDLDNDLLTNLEESQLGTDPNIANGKDAHWLHERWEGTTGYDVANLISEDKFYQVPTFTGLSTGSVIGQTYHSGTRLRAMLTAPETGNYVFWVANWGAVEFWLSTDSTKYAKQRIAVLGSDSGTGQGVRASSAFLWDTYASQMSKPVHLVAGQQYFVEILTQNAHVWDHLSLAWARPGGQREKLDTSHLVSYAKELADADDDYLPDAWETQHGLNPSDNGFADRQKQGERGDFDSDGLTNLEEYLLGTNPANADTDGDGISDFTEVRISRTEVLVSNAPTSAIVSSLNPLTHQGSNLNWTSTGSGIVADQFRGWIQWDFSVPQDGIWLIDLETALRGTARIGDTIGLDVTINNTELGRRNLIYGPDGKDALRLVTPYLTQGTHRLRVNIDNMIARRTVEILALNVLEPSGPDTDGDGIVDWVEAIILENDHVSSTALISKTSPFCLEGHASVVSAVRVEGAGVNLGVDDNHWFTNLPLNPISSTPYTVTFSSGITHTGAITWETTNILTSPNLTIRVGDTLKLGANFTTGTGDTTISAGLQTYTITGSGTALHTFGTIGSYNVTASRNGATSESFSVTVRGATFTNLPAMVDNTLAIWTINKSLVDPALVLEPGRGLRLGTYKNVSSTIYSHTLYPSKGGRLAVAARVGDGGPIAGLAEFFTTGFSDALQNDRTTSYISGIDGYNVVNTPVVFTNLPLGGSIVISIFRSGVMFRDGGSTKTFTAADLSNGILNLEFLFPRDMSGGYCHYFTIYDANGNLVSRR